MSIQQVLFIYLLYKRIRKQHYAVLWFSAKIVSVITLNCLLQRMFTDSFNKKREPLGKKTLFFVLLSER